MAVQRQAKTGRPHLESDRHRLDGRYRTGSVRHGPALLLLLTGRTTTTTVIDSLHGEGVAGLQT
jgi:hypothetical protein